MIQEVLPLLVRCESILSITSVEESLSRRYGAVAVFFLRCRRRHACKSRAFLACVVARSISQGVDILLLSWFLREHVAISRFWIVCALIEKKTSPRLRALEKVQREVTLNIENAQKALASLNLSLDDNLQLMASNLQLLASGGG